MKAILYKGKIETYIILPLELGLTSGIRKLSDEAKYAMGFREVVIPFITETQRLGEIFKDNVNEVYTYPVIDKSQGEINAELATAKKSAISKFEEGTDDLIRSVVGERANEYLLAEEEATVFKAAGYPDLDVPNSVSSDAIANGTSNQIACDLILAMATNWRKAQKDLRANRLLAKAKVKVATTVSDISLVKDTWNEFLMNLRSQIIE
tara:strand:+ start:1234 stop:1857 length:624 start_codon:yes stop_codon:yes gene_type:complete